MFRHMIHNMGVTSWAKYAGTYKEEWRVREEAERKAFTTDLYDRLRILSYICRYPQFFKLFQLGASTTSTRFGLVFCSLTLFTE